jgi:hypothetical protein
VKGHILAVFLKQSCRIRQVTSTTAAMKETPSPENLCLLTITKKSIEREDGGVVACQPVPLAHLHRIPHCRGNSGYQEYPERRRGQEPAYQSIALCLENVCYLLCPGYQFPEEFLNHSDNEKSVGGYLKNPYPEGYTNRFYAGICP